MSYCLHILMHQTVFVWQGPTNILLDVAREQLKGVLSKKYQCYLCIKKVSAFLTVCHGQSPGVIYEGLSS